MLLGCIGDDFTGSSDLANTLSKQGMRTVQYTGIPEGDAASDVEAGVVALKSRSIDPALAVEQSLAALAWLQAQGCTQFIFKYCSTFDSTSEGNIGPVCDALTKALQAEKVIVCPAFPGTGRSVYQGHLFVQDKLLSESGMENHPLTPMTDPDLRRCLQAQSSLSIGHVSSYDVLKGSDAVVAALDEQHNDGHALIVVDAIQDEDLMQIGKAASELKLITGGSGIAMGLPANFKTKGLITGDVTQWQGQTGPCVAISGSCSGMTRTQIEQHAKTDPVLAVSAADVIDQTVTPRIAVDWALAQTGVPLIYSSADPATVAEVQARFGREAAAEALESFFAETAKVLVADGVTRLLVAGGETSGAVVEGLELQTLEIGVEIDPGVPALRASENLVIALKSGNFGAEDYFKKAAAILGDS